MQMQQGLVFNIQKYSISDGPGIRTTVFLKGCPADCWWCHNPESKGSAPEALVAAGRCIACRECASACPVGIVVAGSAVPVREGVCIRCERCIDACCSGARQLAGTPMTVAETMAVILQDRIFYDDSGGGATFSGGEPLQQFTYLVSLLSACREKGINTAVDTGGFAPTEHLLTVAGLTDLFLYDIKCMNEARHREATGLGNTTVLENLRILGDRHPAIWIRIPVIPGFNDDPENLEATARFVSTVRGVRQVNLLPYHRTWLGKGDTAPVQASARGIEAPAMERLEDLAEIFRAHGLKTAAGGGWINE